MKSFFRVLVTALLTLCISAAVYGGKSGNNKEGDDLCTGDPFNPYTGNESRDIRDLEVWGGVGEVPLVWIRYGNSRTGNHRYFFGEAYNWNGSFMYAMSDDGFSDNGQPQITINFPEGGDFIFTRDANDTSHWAAHSGKDRQVFQDGNNFYLQMANGFRYRFEKLADDNDSTYYLLRDFRDSYQNLYTLTYDKKKLIKITEPAGRYLAITHGKINGVAVIIQVSTSDGRSVNYNYDVFNDGLLDWVRLISVDYGDGTHATYEYDYQTAPGSRPHLTHAIDPRYPGQYTNIKYTYSSDVEGFIKEVINGVTDEVMSTLDASSDEKTICYANGGVQVYHTPTKMAGKIKEYTDGLGRITKYTYQNNGEGFMETQTDALGRVTTYNSRTLYGNLLEITYADGCNEKWTRDNLDLILTHKDGLGRVTTYTRDANHRVTRIDYPDGTFETFSYNTFSQVVDHQRRNGGNEHSEYDSRGLKTSFTDALGNVTTYSYDSADRLTSVTDARGNTMRYHYTERGLFDTITNADTTLQTYGYDDFGNRIKFTDEHGHTWNTDYDEFRRPVTKTDPLGRTTHYGYDLPGGVCGCTHEFKEPTTIILPSGKATEITYDLEWKKIGETEGAGSADEATTIYEYDMIGNLVTIIDPRGNEWIFEYDSRNRRSSATNPLGNQTHWTYDCVGNVLTVKRPDDGITSNVYDVMNRVTQTTDPKNETTKFEYDAENNMVNLTDANNHSYTFEYDLLNRKTRMIYPEGKFEAYSYDEVSNLVTYTNRASDVCTYTYDNRNRETLSDWSDNTPDVSSTYSGDNLLLTMSNSVSTLTYTYDAAHELISETQAIADGPAHTVSYSPNTDGFRGTMTNPDGSEVSYDYTGRNQLSTISVDGSPALVTYTYDLNGNRLTKDLENETHTNYAWDEANRNINVDHQNSSGSFARFDYGYDNVNRRTFMRRDNEKGDTYSYDAIDQITYVKYNVDDPSGAANNPDRTVTYDWDPVGNKDTITDNGTPTSYTTNSKNQYTNVGGDALTYNANGDLKKFVGWSYTSDGQDRMTKATNGSTTVTFKYDARNRCVKRTINGTKTFFYFDGWNLIDERNTNDVQLVRYVNGAMMDEILSKTSSGSSVYYHHDALGNVVRLTDNGGDVIEQYSYDVFGVPKFMSGGGSMISATAYGNRFLFTGREWIGEIGLYDYRNRMYSPQLGRFLQTDLLRFDANDINIYRYVGNNPISRVDPTGLGWVEDDNMNFKTKWHLVSETYEEDAADFTRLIYSVTRVWEAEVEVDCKCEETGEIKTVSGTRTYTKTADFRDYGGLLNKSGTALPMGAPTFKSILNGLGKILAGAAKKGIPEPIPISKENQAIIDSQLPTPTEPTDGKWKDHSPCDDL